VQYKNLNCRESHLTHVHVTLLPISNRSAVQRTTQVEFPLQNNE